MRLTNNVRSVSSCPSTDERRRNGASTEPGGTIMKHRPNARGRLSATALATLFALGLAGAGGRLPAGADARRAVKAGKLPPVAERLPETPFVETMVDGVGKYGGTLRTTILANGDQYNLTRTIANELLVRWEPRMDEVVPSLAEEVTASDDATTYTFKLRKGLQLVRRRSPSPPTTSCSGTRTCSSTPALSPEQEPDLHGRRQAGGGHRRSTSHGGVQVRRRPTACSCSSSPTARATCR